VNHEIVLNKQQAQQVINLFLEAGASKSAGLTKALAIKLRAYATWQGLDNIVIAWRMGKHPAQNEALFKTDGLIGLVISSWHAAKEPFPA
jgi:hypothetical protein